MTTDLDALLEDVAAAQARIDAGTANMGEYDALSDAAPILAAEVQRLRDGGCARDQRTTQFCAEVVERDAEIARLRAEVRKVKLALVERIGEDRALEDCTSCDRPTTRWEVACGGYPLCPACAIQARDEVNAELRAETATLAAEAREARAALVRVQHTLRGLVAFPDIEHTPDPELPPNVREALADVCTLLDARDAEIARLRAAMLAAEVKRLRTLLHEQNTTIAQTLAAAMGCYPHAPDEAGNEDPTAPYVVEPAIAEDVAQAAADMLREMRLTLAAEQGRQEGAPGPGWEYGGQMWHRGRHRCTTCRGGWEWWIRAPSGTVLAEGRAPSARAAMIAADEVSRG